MTRERPGPWIGAVDQGTTSTRFLVFDSEGQVVASAQRAVQPSFPTSGWVEQDPQELLDTVIACIDEAAAQIERAHRAESLANIKAIGIANQRETTIAWNAATGTTLGPAIVWMDTRIRSMVNDVTLAPNQTRITGLPKSTYFSAGKMRWILESQAARATEAKNLRLGTVDSWLLWNLVEGSPHITDVTNAHRTALLDIEECRWSEEQLAAYRIARESLPEIRSSAEFLGRLRVSRLKGVPVTGVLGDQHAALLGHGCTARGNLKNTYGTGCFMLCNTEDDLVRSAGGLLSTIAYQLGPDKRPQYALEGPISNAGAAIEWLAQRIGMLRSPRDLDAEAAGSSEGVLFVPSLSGSLAPRWNPSARGAFLNLRLSTTRSHMIKSVVDSIAFSVKEILEVMEREGSLKIKQLVVDGGLSHSRALLRTQANILGIPVARAEMVEATALGAAKAAAIGLGLQEWPRGGDGAECMVFRPMSDDVLSESYERWKAAVDFCNKWDSV